MSPNRGEKFSQIATGLGFIVDSATVLSWVLSLISAIALASQPEPPKFPGINFELGPWYQFVLLLCGALAYLHFLRSCWIKDNSEEDPLADTFRDFLWHDLLHFKRPLLLIPIFFFFVIWIVIFVSSGLDENFSFFMFSLISLFGGFFMASIIYRPVIKDSHKVNWENDSELKARWFNRIYKELQQNGFVDTLTFKNNVGLDLHSLIDNEEVNWALEMYFHQYEFEQDLILSPEYVVRDEKDPMGHSIICRTLGFRVTE